MRGKRSCNPLYCRGCSNECVHEMFQIRQGRKENYYKAIKGKKTNDLVVNKFAELVEKKNFDKNWVDAFLDSMEMDIHKNSYETLNETIEYIYGSAEVIGLMMAKIMNLSKESFYNDVQRLLK